MASVTSAEELRRISPREFAAFGMEDLAYIRCVVVDDRPAFAIHAADGSQIAVMRDRTLAVATIRHHEWEPVSLH
jgi:hypothetical protein